MSARAGLAGCRFAVQGEVVEYREAQRLRRLLEVVPVAVIPRRLTGAELDAEIARARRVASPPLAPRPRLAI